MPALAAPSASAARACLASAMMPVAPSRSASRGLTLMLANRTAGLANSECEAVAKSVSRAPTVSTRSASRARALAAGVPSRPMPPICHQARCCTAPLPAKVSSHREADRPGQALELGGGAGVDDPAARDDQRPFRGGQHGEDGADLARSGCGRRITQSRSAKNPAG